MPIAVPAQPAPSCSWHAVSSTRLTPSPPADLGHGHVGVAALLHRLVVLVRERVLHVVLRSARGEVGGVHARALEQPALPFGERLAEQRGVLGEDTGVRALGHGTSAPGEEVTLDSAGGLTYSKVSSPETHPMSTAPDVNRGVGGSCARGRATASPSRRAGAATHPGSGPEPPARGRTPGAAPDRRRVSDLGITHQAILHHFSSRAGLLSEVASDAIARLALELIDALRSHSERPDDRELLERVFRTFGEDGQARAIAWLELSGLTPSPPATDETSRSLRRVAEVLHERRGAGSVSENTLFTVLLGSLAVLRRCHRWRRSCVAAPASTMIPRRSAAFATGSRSYWLRSFVGGRTSRLTEGRAPAGLQTQESPGRNLAHARGGGIRPGHSQPRATVARNDGRSCNGCAQDSDAPGQLGPKGSDAAQEVGRGCDIGTPQCACRRAEAGRQRGRHFASGGDDVRRSAAPPATICPGSFPVSGRRSRPAGGRAPSRVPIGRGYVATVVHPDRGRTGPAGDRRRSGPAGVRLRGQPRGFAHDDPRQRVRVDPALQRHGRPTLRTACPKARGVWSGSTA